jgi:hypothetical protein
MSSARFVLLDTYLHQANFGMVLVDNGLDVSFSQVGYREVAPRVGLKPLAVGADMKTFEIHRAGIPTDMFEEIVGDIQVVTNQYSELRDHENKEARSRFLALVSAQRASPAIFLCSRFSSFSIEPSLSSSQLFLILRNP